MPANRLKELRKSQGISQIQFAKILHSSQQAISRIENGTGNISSEMLIKISEFFNVTTDYILCLSDNKRDSTRQLQAMNEFEQFHDFLQRYQRLNPLMQDAMLNMLEQLENIQENTILINSFDKTTKGITEHDQSGNM